MTAVAGDFYEFVPVDDHRVGILIADVAGGWPLILSSLKSAEKDLLRPLSKEEELQVDVDVEAAAS